MEEFRPSPDLKSDVYITQSHDLVPSSTGLAAAVVFIVQVRKNALNALKQPLSFGARVQLICR